MGQHPELVELKLVGDETCPSCGKSIVTEQELAENAKECVACKKRLDALDKSREEAVKVISQDGGQGSGFFSLVSGHSNR